MPLRMWAGIGTVCVLLGAWFAGYRLTPLAAAKVNDGPSVHEFGVVSYPWGRVLLLNTPKGSRTALVSRSVILWRNPANSVVGPERTGPVHTVGWMSYTGDGGRQQATVVAVKVSDPAIAYIAVGPSGSRQRKTVELNKPLIFSWNRMIGLNHLRPIALSKTGRELYRYGYPLNTSVFDTSLLRWYPVPATN